MLVRTSGTSATKRLYAFICGCSNIAYKTSVAGAWSSLALPSGEYIGAYQGTLGKSNGGKAYFYTVTHVETSIVSSAGTIRIRTVDESGNIELVATLPDIATMFNTGTWGSTLRVLSVTPNIKADGTVGSVTIVVGRVMTTGWGAYVREYVV
jgi:hypothetical protein